MKKILFAMIAMILMVGSVMAVSYSDLSVKKVADTTTNNYVDIAVDSSDNVHRVYERNNKIYYSMNDGAEELISKGVNPAIAVGPDNKPQIIFENNDQVNYVQKVDGDWVYTKFNGHNADIAVDSNNMPYIVYMNADSYPDVMLATISGAVATHNIIFDGAYTNFGGGSHTTNSYDNPLIKIDSNDKYHVIAWHFNRDCAGRCDNLYETLYTSNANGGMSSSGPERAYTKNALTVDSNNVAHLVYGENPVYYATLGNTWNEVVLADWGSKAAIDSRDSITGVAYTYGGDLYYLEDAGLGFSEAEFVDVGNTPVVGVGSAFVDYLKGGQIYEAYVKTGSSSHQDPVVTPSYVSGFVTKEGKAVEGAQVVVVCGNVSSTVSTNIFGAYYVSFTSDVCGFGTSIDVTASKDDQAGHNTGNMCGSDEKCELNIPLGSVDVEIPEFGVVAGAIALLAGIGIVAYRRK